MVMTNESTLALLLESRFCQLIILVAHFEVFIFVLENYFADYNSFFSEFLNYSLNLNLKFKFNFEFLIISNRYNFLHACVNFRKFNLYVK